MTDKTELLELMIKDALDAVEALYGPIGLRGVVAHMRRANRTREDNAEIDTLEKALGLSGETSEHA